MTISVSVEGAVLAAVPPGWCSSAALKSASPTSIRLTNAKAVSVTDVSDDSGKVDAGLARQWGLAWVGMHGSDGAEQAGACRRR
jgi:hypothetical protein